MKTSQSQYEIMLSYMEKYGDLTKPITNNPRGKIATLEHWEKLTSLLNKDGSGVTKTVEKWKKVWSDLKNNVKKKASKINKSASGTGGGPASRLKLTDVEERVLVFVGLEAVTGMSGVNEAGLHQEENVPCSSEQQEENERATRILSPTLPDNLEESVQHWNDPGPSRQIHTESQTALATPVSPILINIDDVFSETLDVKVKLLHHNRSQLDMGKPHPIVPPDLRDLDPLGGVLDPQHVQSRHLKIFFAPIWNGEIFGYSSTMITRL